MIPKFLGPACLTLWKYEISADRLGYFLVLGLPIGRSRGCRVRCGDTEQLVIYISDGLGIICGNYVSPPPPACEECHQSSFVARPLRSFLSVTNHVRILDPKSSRFPPSFENRRISSPEGTRCQCKAFRTRELCSVDVIWSSESWA